MHWAGQTQNKEENNQVSDSWSSNNEGRSKRFPENLQKVFTVSLSQKWIVVTYDTYNSFVFTNLFSLQIKKDYICLWEQLRKSKQGDLIS